MKKLKIGQTVYIVRHHIKNHRNIGYYIDKCRVCDFGNSFGKGIHKPPYKYVYVDHDLEEIDGIPNKKRKRIYIWNRVHDTKESAQKEVDLKNQLINIRKRYNDDVFNVKEKIYSEKG